MNFNVYQLQYFLRDVFKNGSTFLCGMLPVSFDISQSTANYRLRYKRFEGRIMLQNYKIKSS